MEKFFKRLTVFLSGFLAVAMVALVFAVPVYVKSDRKIDFFGCNEIVNNVKNLQINMTSVIYVKDNGGNWVEYQRLHGNENRIWTSYDNVPKNLANAFVSIEDERFYSHAGVDWKRTFAAMGNLIFKYYSSNQGGSTITQQLIKNITGDKDESVYRKMREIVRALAVETKLDKDQILEAYLNTIALGNGICGVKVAAEYYFNKDVKDLSLVECAAIAAITKNPSNLEPEKHPEQNKERRQVVLDKMLELGKITQEEHDEAYDQDLAIDTSRQDDYEIDVNNYFVDALIENVISELMVKYNCTEKIASSMLYNGGYKIYATMDQNVQATMEKVYSNVSTYFKQTNAQGEHVQSAMTVMDYSGHIVGIVGGAGEKTVSRGLNRATSSPRQPGSTMKPLGVYCQAIDKNIINYSSMVLDKPIENYYSDGKAGPKEWYGYYKGNVTVQYALEKSCNTIPVRVLQDLGVEESFDFLTTKLHLSHLVPEDKNLASLALGGCHYGITTTESAAAYAVFGNGGKYFKPTTYYKIERSNGEVILQADEQGTQIIKESTATIMNHLLQNVVYGSQGTGKGIAGYSSMKAYAKTGTSSESNDLWMAAGTPYYVGSVWYGFDTPQPVGNGGAAATVWKTVMKEVHNGLEKKEFTDSADVVEEKYCTSTGLLATNGCGKVVGYFDKNALPATCARHGSSSSHSSESEKPSDSGTTAEPSETTPTTPTPDTPQQTESSSSPSASSSSTSSTTPSKPTTSSTPATSKPTPPDNETD